MFRRSATILLLTTSCASATPSGDPPRTDIVIDEPLAPSSLPGFGVTETVRGAAGAERAVRAVTDDVARCVKSTAEREPALTGAMTFRIESEAYIAIKPATGSLAALPVAACVRDALGAVKTNAAIDYTLTFNGNPQPDPIRAGATLRDEWIAIDWGPSATGALPDLSKIRQDLRERLLRCAFATEPLLSERLWLTGRVAKGGAVTLGVAKPGDASDCIQRAIRSGGLPDAGREYAFNVMLRPSLEAPTPTPEYEAAIGSLTGTGVGDSTGLGGLVLTAPGGGGGIGLGAIGTLGTGSGGFGTGNGRLGPASGTKSPSLKTGGTTVSGRLPPEVIQRIVRSHFGRFRLCYERGLQDDPGLRGKVSVSFEINRKGDTGKISSTSDMKAPAVVACLERAFSTMSFPQPEAGVVRVTYPIAFAPGDDVPASKPTTPAAPDPPRTIGRKPIDRVSLIDVEKRLLAKGFEVARVPGEAPVLFVNDEPNRRVYSLTLDVPRTQDKDALCKAGDERRQLTLRGDHCEHVLGSLLD